MADDKNNVGPLCYDVKSTQALAMVGFGNRTQTGEKSAVWPKVHF